MNDDRHKATSKCLLEVTLRFGLEETFLRSIFRSGTETEFPFAFIHSFPTPESINDNRQYENKDFNSRTIKILEITLVFCLICDGTIMLNETPLLLKYVDLSPESAVLIKKCWSFVNS